MHRFACPRATCVGASLSSSQDYATSSSSSSSSSPQRHRKLQASSGGDGGGNATALACWDWRYAYSAEARRGGTTGIDGGSGGDGVDCSDDALLCRLVVEIVTALPVAAQRLFRAYVPTGRRLLCPFLSRSYPIFVVVSTASSYLPLRVECCGG